MPNIIDNEQQNNQGSPALKDHSELAKIQQRAEVAEEEVMALRQQHLILKNLYDKEKDRALTFQTEKQALSDTLESKDKQIDELQQQVEMLSIVSRAEANTEINNQLKSSLESLQALQEEHALVSKSLGESQQHSRQLERVIQFLRERGEEAHLEVKQLREEFQASREIGVKYTQLIDTLKEKEAQLLTAEQEIQQLQQKIKSSEEGISTLRNQIEEKEQELKVAQQHLARKVKEVSIFSSKNEEQYQRISELQQMLANDQNKLSSLQNQIDTQIQNEKNLQAQFNERITSIEAHIEKWEKKYFQEHEKCQDLEQENRSLQSIKEKHKQAYLMINNLSALLEPMKIMQEEVSKAPSLPIPIVINESTQSLFERPIQAVRHKKTLFD